MSDTVPHIDLGLTPGGMPVVMVGRAGQEARDMATLLRLAPGIALPAMRMMRRCWSTISRMAGRIR